MPRSVLAEPGDWWDEGDKATGHGFIGTYVHFGGRIGAMVELRCETERVAASEELHRLAHDLALQVAATAPRAVGHMASLNEEGDETLLLNQRYLKDPTISVRDLLRDNIAGLGEPIRISRFVRFVVGVGDAELAEMGEQQAQ